MEEENLKGVTTKRMKAVAVNGQRDNAQSLKGHQQCTK